MTKKERVLAAINHIKPDKVPKGELAIEAGLLNDLLKDEKFANLSPLAQQIAVLDAGYRGLYVLRHDKHR
jgi:hypothetical protein